MIDGLVTGLTHELGIAKMTELGLQAHGKEVPDLLALALAEIES